ncbi:MAG: hypothetical protein EB015_21330 [Methylocystaceae bacterium]|nr:hypothetical protein [Methylocystaceae bacterium]
MRNIASRSILIVCVRLIVAAFSDDAKENLPSPDFSAALTATCAAALVANAEKTSGAASMQSLSWLLMVVSTTTSPFFLYSVIFISALSGLEIKPRCLASMNTASLLSSENTEER